MIFVGEDCIWWLFGGFDWCEVMYVLFWIFVGVEYMVVLVELYCFELCEVVV